MQIKLETLTATYRKSAYIQIVTILYFEGCKIQLKLSGRDVAIGSHILKPGYHVEYKNETFTILDIRQEGFPKFFILTLDRDFPKETFHHGWCFLLFTVTGSFLV